MQNASADGGKYRDAMIARKAVAVSGGRMLAVTGTGGRASMTECDGCPGCAVAGRPKMVVREALDTCQALCDVMSQKTRDAEICDNTRYGERAFAVHIQMYTDLVLGAFRIQHSKQHFSVAVASGLVGFEDFTEGWRRRLENAHDQDDTR